ncbi:MAG: FixH family protein [Bdellovibrionales bacterium]|nr:FixH family protein [Bdellovibrionales bacterium]
MSRTLYVSLSILTLLFSGALLACDSPLLDHVNANDVVREPLREAGDCPIAFPVHKLCASWTWDRMPTDSDLGTAQLRFWKADVGTVNGPFVDPHHEVFVKLWMPAMGHGSSPVTTEARVDASGAKIPGLYDASKVFFVMPGKWEIWVQLKTAGQVHEQAKLDVEI